MDLHWLPMVESAMHFEELRELLDRHATADWTTAVDGLLISKIPEPGPPSASMTGTVLALIAQGAKQLAVGERQYEYRAGSYFVASVDLPVHGRFLEGSHEEPVLGFALELRPTEVASLLLEMTAMGHPPGATSGKRVLPGIAVGDVSPELLDASLRLLRLLDNPRDIPVLAPLVKREILWRLMTGEHGQLVRQVGLTDSNLGHVAPAIRWIRDNYAEPFRVDDVASMAGMSVSAFHRNFQAVTAMSPIQFQKQIRLQEARLLLAARSDDVARIGHLVGYDSPSQFSREYKRQFGASPSQDAARVRDPGAADVPTAV